jgi:hypothetical protein
MFPVYVYEDGLELPKEGTYFLVAGNGNWLHKDTGIVKAFVPVEKVSVLEDFNANAFVQCSLPKIPFKHVWKIKTFFRKVVEIHHAESNTNLYFNKETQEFKINVPKQSVSHGGVNYKLGSSIYIEGMEDFLCVGTIHSHCDFNSFHSGTDVKDEEDFDGLHCTFGNNDLDEFTISASVVVNGHRLVVDPLDVLEGIEPTSKNGIYKLADLAPELEWNFEIEDWLSQIVNRLPVKRFNCGDKVDWVGDLNTVSFKEMCGKGPFKVDSINEGFVTVVTKNGLARFNEKLLKRI